MNIKLDIIQSLAFAILILIIGDLLSKKIKLLENSCIPVPVIGGVIFSIITLLGHVTQRFYFEFDETLKNIFLIGFFTTIGFSANLKQLKKGGVQVIIFLFLSILLLMVQNLLGIYLAKLFHLHPYIGLATGSTALMGGPGTSAAFGPLFEDAGVQGASTIAMTAATFGLVMGSVIGGPVGKILIEKNSLYKTKKSSKFENTTTKIIRNLNPDSLLKSSILIVVAMGIGSIISNWFKDIGLTFPPYMGGMLSAAVITNIYDLTNHRIIMEEIDALGNICLSFFLSMALMSLKLWHISSLAFPLITILFVQVIMITLFSYTIVFKVMGKDYDAAIICSGICGFGLGATANAIANMETLTSRYNIKAFKSFFIVTLVGALFIDFFNALAITFFMNIFK